LRILFDQDTPVPLAKQLQEHAVSTAYEMGWSSLENGQLIAQAQAHDFDLLITTDQNLRYQQNLKDRRIGILVLSTTSWPRIQAALPQVIQAVEGFVAGSYTEIAIPYLPSQ
jgi:uncharacterized linocin/CFP29 family protein